MSLEEKFLAAGKVIKGMPRDGTFQPSNEVKLQFYSLYKQATDGVCIGTRPGWWDVEARAKYDAWKSLKNMDKNTAMVKYIDLIKQFIETMTFSSEVEGFMETIGPFYETVDEDQSDSKDSESTGENNLTDEDQEDDIYQTIEQMIGRYVPPEDGLFNVDPDEDFIRQYPCKGDALMLAKPKSAKRKVSRKKPPLFKTDSEDSDCDISAKIGDINDDIMMEGNNFVREIEETKKALDATQEILKDMKAERVKLNGSLIQESFEDENDPSQMNLDKMLGRYDGFVPPTIDIEDLQISLDHNDYNQNNMNINDVITSRNQWVLGSTSSAPEIDEKILIIDLKDKKDAFVSDNNQIDKVDIQDSDDEIFEDPMTEDLIESNDSGISEELESNKSFSKSIDFALSNQKQSFDSSIKSNSLSGSFEKNKSVLNAPIHVRRTPSCQSVARYECEEDEILIVSSECNDISDEIMLKGGHEAGRLSQSRNSFDYNYQVHWTVERLSRDMDHVIARMHTLEALVTVHRQVERNNSGPSWWPFQELKPKTLLFVVTWPLIAHGLIVLLKAAARRARR